MIQCVSTLDSSKSRSNNNLSIPPTLDLSKSAWHKYPYAGLLCKQSSIFCVADFYILQYNFFFTDPLQHSNFRTCQFLLIQECLYGYKMKFKNNKYHIS